MKKLNAKLKRRAKQLARPLYTRPEALAKRNMGVALRSEYLARQDAVHRVNEHERLVGQLNAALSPGARAELMAQKARK